MANQKELDAMGIKKIEHNTHSREYANYNNNDYNRNKIAFFIKAISIIGSIIGIIASCSLFSSAHTEELAIPYIIACVVGGIFSYALGEIIQLLEDIKNK